MQTNTGTQRIFITPLNLVKLSLTIGSRLGNCACLPNATDTTRTTST